MYGKAKGLWTHPHILFLIDGFPVPTSIAKNKALQQIRKNNTRAEKTEGLKNDIASQEPNALEQFIFRELNQDIEFLINTLPEKRKLIFRLNRFDGFTYKEIAG